MTVEAALAFSFFLFFFVNVLGLIFLFIRYAEGLETLQQRGKQAAAYAYAADSLLEGSDGLIRLYDAETVDSPFPLIAAPTARLFMQSVVKPWTGYAVTGTNAREAEEEVVYMTENGTVYHLSRSCTHLALSVRAVAFESLEGERNASGGRYSPCESCGQGAFSGLAYLTTYGNRYHSSLSCPGLKRTVRQVFLSDIPGVPGCSKCA